MVPLLRPPGQRWWQCSFCLTGKWPPHLPRPPCSQLNIPWCSSATFLTVLPELPVLSPALTPQPLLKSFLKKQFLAPWDQAPCAAAPGPSAGMSQLLPQPSAHSRRRQSSQQSVIAPGRLQLILLEEFHQSPLPRLLRGSLVTSQIPPRTRQRSQTLQGWDSRVRLSGQHKQPPKAQVLPCISSSMTSCCVFQAVPAFSSRAVHCFPCLSLMHSLGALRARTLFRARVEHRLVSSQMLLGAGRKSLKARWRPPCTAPPLPSRSYCICTVRNRGQRARAAGGPASSRALSSKTQLSRAPGPAWAL